jgi:hypothetical protein
MERREGWRDGKDGKDGKTGKTGKTGTAGRWYASWKFDGYIAGG